MVVPASSPQRLDPERLQRLHGRRLVLESDPGAKFNPGPLEDALGARVGDELLLPVYDPTARRVPASSTASSAGSSSGSPASTARATTRSSSGHFIAVAWEGTPSESGDNFFGATVVKLVS